MVELIMNSERNLWFRAIEGDDDDDDDGGVVVEPAENTTVVVSVAHDMSFRGEYSTERLS